MVEKLLMYGQILVAAMLLRASESHETMLEKYNDMDYSFTQKDQLGKTTLFIYYLFTDYVKMVFATNLKGQFTQE